MYVRSPTFGAASLAPGRLARRLRHQEGEVVKLLSGDHGEAEADVDGPAAGGEADASG